MTTWYDSYEKALARVNAIRREHRGAWPGIVGPHCTHMGCPRPARCRFRRSHAPDWRWRLTFDPQQPW